MKLSLLSLYDRGILGHPIASLIISLASVVFFLCWIPHFKLDASSDSLVLEGDADLRYHRHIVERYGTKDVLVITYTPRQDLFAETTLTDIKELRDELRTLKGVDTVLTLLDVPILMNSDLVLGDLDDKEKIKSFEQAGVSAAAIKAELHKNPLYKGKLISPDEKNTAILLILSVDQHCRDLLNRRSELWDKQHDNNLTPVETEEYERVSRLYRECSTQIIEQDNQLVQSVRTIMNDHRMYGDLFLGGVPMIISDMISYVRSDLVTFGVGVALFLVVTLGVIFRRPRWVFLSMLCCILTVVVMVGFLGMMDWRVTVISSNFVSLMIILTLSLTIHLTQRYLEVQSKMVDADQRELVKETVRTIVLPCFYSTITTVVAFFSLLISDIRPVMDFGKMMTIGLGESFIFSFILFPAALVLLPKRKMSRGAGESPSRPMTFYCARFVKHHGMKLLVGCLILAIISVVGMSRLKVENRFIDYFRKKTEIYQGMNLIDQKLGGTTPLDVIIDFERKKLPSSSPESGDELLEEMGLVESEAPWYADASIMKSVETINDYLENLPESGEVLSLASAVKIARKLNKGLELDNYELALLIKRSPSELKELLLDPYAAEDVSQARFAMRVIESDRHMEREKLLDGIREFLQKDLGIPRDRIHFTNMFILYNNMLQSLFKSQILTIGLVFLAILLMFIILFRSWYLAVVAIVPSLLPVAVVLGTMGLLGIPLDMMTITIASITIGIAVDDTIHFVHRFQREFPTDRDYMKTLYRCHGSIGKAMFYTSVTIILGFSILMLSNFIPTIYFGLFTGFAMLIALLSNLTLLPQLIIMLRPLGRGNRCAFTG